MTVLPPPLGLVLAGIDARLAAVATTAAAHYPGDDPGHDWLHILRVVEQAIAIGRAEGADLRVLVPASLFHDAVNLRKDDPRRSAAAGRSAELAQAALAPLGYHPEELGRIAAVICEHSYSLNLPPTSVEAAVLQDADKLDALGAVGLMRAVVCGTRLGTQFYDPEDPGCVHRTPNDRRYMLDHFFAKLLSLEQRFHFDSARAEARRRIRFMHRFVAQLQRELVPEAEAFDTATERRPSAIVARRDHRRETCVRSSSS